jgi:nucleoside-diphosphate-sugar epimerase
MNNNNQHLAILNEQQALDKAANILSGQTQHVFVTGAGGFLGIAICRLLRSANINVTGFARGHYPELSQMGVNMIQGDISDFSQVKSAMKSCDLVFHVAAKAGVWGSLDDYFKPNVQGTQNIINACQSLGISRLVYTSTPSVTFAGVDEVNIDESQPYADNYLNYYGQTKAQAEQLVLAAAKTSFKKNAAAKISTDNSTAEESNSPKEPLKTVALRPHLIWGPNDPHLVPRVLERAHAGKLKLVGKEDKLVDTIYVDNAAYAHILAAIALAEPKSKCNGKAYFISNDEPITMAAMLNKILACDGLPPVCKRVPSAIAYAVGATLETVYKLFNKKQEPIMTRFVARQLSTSHYFDISRAKSDFGYKPLVDIDEGMQRLNASLK